MQKENLNRAVKYVASWVDFNFPHSHTDGLVVAIQQDDKIVLEKAYGFANLERKSLMKPDTIFRIASHSKMFTAVALLQLAEQKKIILTKPLVSYLPWLAQAKDTRYSHITAEQVLQNGAGIIRDGEDGDFWNLMRPFPNKERLQKEFLATSLVFGPNKQFKYSNYGFSLLGMVIEEVSGMTYAQYVQKHIFNPLAMRNSGADISAAEDLKNFAVGYSRKDTKGKRAPFKNVSAEAMASATGLYSTAADLCKFSRIFYEKTPVLSKKSLQYLSKIKWDTSDAKNKESLYGMGVEQEKVGDRYYIGHSGGFPGFMTYTSVDTKEKISIVVLTNSMDGEVWMIRTQIAKILQLFEKQFYSQEAKKRDVYEGRYGSIWEVKDIINVADKLIANSPFQWGFSEKSIAYSHIGGDIFKIAKANGFYAVGEKAVFVKDSKGKIGKVIQAGSTLKKIK